MDRLHLTGLPCVRGFGGGFSCVADQRGTGGSGVKLQFCVLRGPFAGQDAVWNAVVNISHAPCSRTWSKGLGEASHVLLMGEVALWRGVVRPKSDSTHQAL